MNLTLGFSPCPNDTFLFDALVHNRIDTKGYNFKVQLGDVEDLNEKAMEGAYDITKLSYHAFAYLTKDYQMLRSGSALGEGVGPLLVVKGERPEKPSTEWSVAIPGKFTTAHLLLKLAFPEITVKECMIFSEIERAVIEEKVDAGVLIHENRFTYHEKGLSLIADLGELWEQKQAVPIPLGGIAIKRTLDDKVKKDIEALVRQSVEYAFQHPEDSLPFVKKNAQEMDPVVMQKHIALYVNPYTVDLGEKGVNAVNRMLNVLKNQSSIPAATENWLV